MNTRPADPAAVTTVLIVAVVLVILIAVIGFFVLIPVAAALIGWRIYVNYRRRPMKTDIVLAEAQQSLVERIPFPSLTEFSDSLVHHLVNQWENRQPVFVLFTKIAGVARAVYEAEEILALPELTPNADAIEEARYRDKLLVYIRKTQDTAGNVATMQYALAEAFSNFLAGLSSIAITADTLDSKDLKPFASVRTLDLITDVQATLSNTIAPFFRAEVTSRGLFKDLRRQIDVNAGAAPKDHKGTPAEAVDAYLADTSLHPLFQGTVPFNPDDEVRFSGQWIVGSQGKGKTTLLAAMVRQDFDKDAAVIIMDGKGDLIDQVSNLAALQHRYVVIDPRETGINPLDVNIEDITQATERLEYVFSALLEAKITPLQSILFRNVLRALVTAFPEPTLATFQDILLNGFEKYAVHIDTLRSDLKDFFYKQFNRDVYVSRRNEVLARLDLLLTSEPIRNMMLVPKTNFNVAHAMDEGKIIIINNSVSILGEQGAEFLGRYFISQIWAAATARSGRAQKDKKPCFFYIDEAHRVIKRDEKISQIIDDCRSQRLALIVAHQRLDQIESADVLSALSNCALRYASTDTDANVLALKLRTTAAHIHSLGVGQFAAFVRDATPNAVTISVIPADFDMLPKIPPKVVQLPEPEAAVIPEEQSPAADPVERLW